ncbi:MAG: methyltransferase domain-containing protein [Pseudolabrys sp.]|nr:methyltransferase domain-containing protein [Pseudolabrys sp.]MBV9261161.1 methyltransferase domain-containing protein [Pseudolabrys sp.]
MRDGATALRPIAPVSLSSGDLIADRRYEWARAAQEKGNLEAAVDLLRQALELVPGYAAAWFALGEVRAARGDAMGAVDAFEQARAADPADRLGAALQLARFEAAAPVMPPAYVRAVFDQYAGDFDRALVEGLSYRAPQLLLDAVKATGVRMKFGSVLDLGCGTGLTGTAFRPFCDWLVGVDLSAGMIEKARTKDLYDRLDEADIGEFLRGEGSANYQLVLSGDVFVYLPYLEPTFTLVAAVLAPGGLFAFTTETHEGNGAILRDTLRYAHGEPHVRDALRDAKLDLVSLNPAATRNEKGEPVPGLVVVVRKG